MADERKLTISEKVANSDMMTEAIRQGVREELLAHAEAGNRVPSWESGRIVWSSPDEIYRRLGFERGPEARGP